MIAEIISFILAFTFGFVWGRFLHNKRVILLIYDDKFDISKFIQKLKEEV